MLKQRREFNVEISILDILAGMLVLINGLFMILHWRINNTLFLSSVVLFLMTIFINSSYSNIVKQINIKKAGLFISGILSLVIIMLLTIFVVIMIFKLLI